MCRDFTHLRMLMHPQQSTSVHHTRSQTQRHAPYTQASYHMIVIRGDFADLAALVAVSRMHQFRHSCEHGLEVSARPAHVIELCVYAYVHAHVCTGPVHACISYFSHVLYFTILYFTILYYAIIGLNYIILHFTILYYAIIVLNYTILCYTIIFYTILYYNVLYYVLHYTSLYYTILYYNVPYHSVLCCTTTN
jgi:hypothetical protein